MRTIRVTFEDDSVLTTSINGTDDEIRQYYIGRVFNLGHGAADYLTTGKTVDFLDVVKPSRGNDSKDYLEMPTRRFVY